MSPFLSKQTFGDCFARTYETMVTPPATAHWFSLWFKSDMCHYKLTILATNLWCNLGRLCSL